MNAQAMQVLRTIDKFDKIGRNGVVELLQKPADEFGADLDVGRAELIGSLLDTRGATNQETIGNLRSFLKQASRVRSRFELMACLEMTVEPDGTTKWDRLIAMPQNQDETWNAGGRPANIGWALDDMIECLTSLEGDKSSG